MMRLYDPHQDAFVDAVTLRPSREGEIMPEWLGRVDVPGCVVTRETLRRRAEICGELEDGA